MMTDSITMPKRSLRQMLQGFGAMGVLLVVGLWFFRMGWGSFMATGRVTESVAVGLLVGVIFLAIVAAFGYGLVLRITGQRIWITCREDGVDVQVNGKIRHIGWDRVSAVFGQKSVLTVDNRVLAMMLQPQPNGGLAALHLLRKKSGSTSFDEDLMTLTFADKIDFGIVNNSHGWGQVFAEKTSDGMTRLIIRLITFSEREVRAMQAQVEKWTREALN